MVAYFTSAGLPTDQIGEIRLSTLMRRHGSDLDHGPPPPAEFMGYTTILTRVLDGVRVEGSFAWAQFSADGSVVSEQVWWPEIPQAAADQARTMKNSLSAPGAESALRAKLPPSVASSKGEVVLHHAPPLAVAWFAPSPCSTGPAYDYRTQFQFETRDRTYCRRCTPRCGVTVTGTSGTAIYPIEALPSGQCQVENETCSMAGSVTCCDGSQGPVDGFKCRCIKGAWTCTIIDQGTAGCNPCDGGLPDATTD